MNLVAKYTRDMSLLPLCTIIKVLLRIIVVETTPHVLCPLQVYASANEPLRSGTPMPVLESQTSVDDEIVIEREYHPLLTGK